MMGSEAVVTESTPLREQEVRPPWWRIAVAVLIGVNGGGLLFLLFQKILGFIASALLGSDWLPHALTDSWIGLLADSLRWAVATAVMQLVAVAFSGWSKSVLWTAALQTFWMVLIYANPKLAFLWVLPIIIAFGLLRIPWLHQVAGFIPNAAARRASR